jgi:hypothetical protein
MVSATQMVKAIVIIENLTITKSKKAIKKLDLFLTDGKSNCSNN